MFAHLSDYPDFADKLNIFIAIAPIASITYLESEIFDVLSYTPLADILQFLRLYDFLPYMDIPTIEYEFCYYANIVCNEIIGLLTSKNITSMNAERLPVIIAHEPGGTSVRNMMHYEQGIHHEASAFCKYDYGALDNMRVYA